MRQCIWPRHSKAQFGLLSSGFDHMVTSTIIVIIMITDFEKLSRHVNDHHRFTGRGHLEAEQLRTLLCACMEESSLKLTEDDVEDLTMALLESAGKDETGVLTFDELHNLLGSHPGLMENLTFR